MIFRKPNLNYTGLSTSAIRYYERQGVLMSSRLRNGHRVYDERAVNELNFLHQSQQLGTTLEIGF